MNNDQLNAKIHKFYVNVELLYSNVVVVAAASANTTNTAAAAVFAASAAFERLMQTIYLQKLILLFQK